MKNKLIISLTSMFVILFVLPLIFVNLAQPHEFMGIMIIFFFGVNPLAIVVISALVGKDIKKMWWTPIVFNIIFLLSYWIVLKEVILDLSFYAAIYLVLGMISMIVSKLVVKNK